MISMQKAALTVSRWCIQPDLRLTGLLEWQAAQPLPVHFTAASTLKQVMTHPVGAAIIGPIPSIWRSRRRPPEKGTMMILLCP